MGLPAETTWSPEALSRAIEITSLDFTSRLFEKTAVVVASGTAYGKYGEGFVRISLTVPDKRLKEAMERIEKEFT